MQKSRITDILMALLIAALIFYSTMFCARKIVESALYRQSRIVSMLVQQDSIGVSGLLEDSRNVNMLVKFAGALTAAYINFELIPLNEPSAFVAVFESLPESCEIESFVYRRKDLYITGVAGDEKAYEDFLQALSGREQFASVSGSNYDSTDGKIHFEIICASEAAEAYLNFD